MTSLLTPKVSNGYRSAGDDGSDQNWRTSGPELYKEMQKRGWDVKESAVMGLPPTNWIRLVAVLRGLWMRESCRIPGKTNLSGTDQI